MIALLNSQNVHAKTHQGVRAKFSELFIKTKVFPVETSDDIALIFKFRQEVDYDFDADITTEEANDSIKRAKAFYLLVKTYFQELNIDSK